ncbi:hypothetical protein XELAEV_18020739mg [Xenopus laevis]|uniref:Uncharacterized protein n=1 Tax=Xenopus laevis TaxID=8355 RepID=A0A974HRA3_XENLA|nr:hypothetical protein XELAEV_18020739mg [Xenopus laevis]
MGRRVGVPVLWHVRRGGIPVGSSILKYSRCACDMLLRRSAPLPAPSLALQQTSCSPLATSTALTGEGGGVKCCCLRAN